MPADPIHERAPVSCPHILLLDLAGQRLRIFADVAGRRPDVTALGRVS